MIELSQKQKDHMLKVLEQNDGNYIKTAKELLISAETVRDVDVVENGKFNATKEGKGPKKLQKHIVAITHVQEPWDNEDKKIKKARKQYDAGTHEMCTGRDGMKKILYAIPRKIPSMKGRPYFYKLEAV